MPRLQINWENVPQQSYMFKIQIPFVETHGDYGLLYAKSITLPKIGVESIDISNTNYKHSIAGKFRRESVTMELYAYQARTASAMLDWFHLVHGEVNGIRRKNFPETPSVSFFNYSTSKAISGWYDEYVRDVLIEELDEEGVEIGRYTLINTYIEDLAFGQFNYESEEIVTITVTLRYEHLEYSRQRPLQIVKDRV